jgi:hypothetical protein
MPTRQPLLVAVALAGFAVAQERVSFPTQDEGLVYADMYGKGSRGVVLAHGVVSTKRVGPNKREP